MAAVAVVAIAALSFRKDDGGGSGCVTRLVDHLPADVENVEGSDLGRARAAGYDDDGDVFQLADSVLATGVAPDPLSDESRLRFEEPSTHAGYDPADVECWLGLLDLTFVASGSFEAGQIDRSDRGEPGSMALEPGFLAYSRDGTPDEMLATRDQPASLRGLVEALDRHGAVSFSGTTTGDDPSGPWSGVALARGDDWEMLVVWSLPDAGAAGDAQAAVHAALADDSNLGDVIEGDPADLLERDGATLWLRAPLAGEPGSWTDPLRDLDPALLVFSDFGD